MSRNASTEYEPIGKFALLVALPEVLPPPFPLVVPVEDPVEPEDPVLLELSALCEVELRQDR